MIQNFINRLIRSSLLLPVTLISQNYTLFQFILFDNQELSSEYSRNGENNQREKVTKIGSENRRSSRGEPEFRRVKIALSLPIVLILHLLPSNPAL